MRAKRIGRASPRESPRCAVQPHRKPNEINTIRRSWRSTPAAQRGVQAGAAGPLNTAASDEWFFTETGQRTWVNAMELNTLTPELPALLAEMGISYDPQRLADALANRPTELAARSVRVAASLGGFIARVLADMASGSLESNAPMRARQLRTVLGNLGPSFVKTGQALSARPDLLPKPYLDALSELQDRLPSFPSSIAYELIQEELGRPVMEVFSELTAEPVAAASLGQVYRGRLRSTGEEVAVKVQRPGIGENIAIDMVLLRRLVSLVDEKVTQLSQPLVPLVDEFAARLFGELDYIQEGKSAEKFGRLYSHVPRVRVPGIKWEATSRRVLTMEWIEGVKLTDEAAMARYGLDIVDFVTVGIECTLRQLLESGFFHADPHPGNLLATTSGDLVYLDFGMMSEAPPQARYAIIAHVVHLVNRDYLAMCGDYYTLEFMDPSVDTTPIAPALAEFFDDVLNDSVSQLNFRAIVDGLGGVLFQYPFRVPAYYALILRSLTVLEGLALTANPNYKLIAAAYPYMARRLLTDPAPELRSSFEDLVLVNGRVRWSRLENLFEEGSKSQDYDPAQLWLLAEWVCSEGGRPVRKPLAAELVRLIDALITSSVREQLSQRSGNAALALRLVPGQPDEQLSVERAHLLWGVLTSGAGRSVPMPQLSTGLLGLPGPGEVQQYVARLQAALSGAAPRLQTIFEKPGSQELVADVQWGLLRRFAARSIKFLTGISDSAGGGGSTNPELDTPPVAVVRLRLRLRPARLLHGMLPPWAVPAFSGWHSPESDHCANATYAHRLDDASNFNFCSVPGGGSDAFLFAAAAVLVACCLHFSSSLSAVFVLVAGAIAEGFVMLQVMVFAFLVVLLSCLLATPVLLYGLGLAAHGWHWQHGALFAAMLAPTDALAITAVLRRAGIVMFQLFLSLVQQLPAGGGSEGSHSPLSVLPLAAGGVLVGLAAGWLTRRLLRTLRWHGASLSQEVAAIQAMGYLAFYVANSPLKVSGVIAVVVYGLYGNSTSHFELVSSRHMRELEAVQSTLSFALNGIVFFFAGASATNFMIRAVETLHDYRVSFALFPPVYLTMFLIRGISILLFNPLFHLLGSQALPLRAVLFATWGGLRGAISLIMAQVVVTDEVLASHGQLVSAQMGLWTSLFVLSTLIINAPTVPAVLQYTGLTKDLKNDEDEMLRGVDWGAVARYVDLSEELQTFDTCAGTRPTTGGADAASAVVLDAGAAGREAPPSAQQADAAQGGSSEAPPAAAAGAQPASRELPTWHQQEELLLSHSDSAGWAAPSRSCSWGKSRREEALDDLGKTSSKSPLNSSRRLLGASFAHVSHKWEPRSTVPPHGHGASTSDDGSESDLEAPLLQHSLSTHRGRYRAAVAAAQGTRDSLLHRTVSASSSGSSGTIRPPAAADTAGGSSSDVRDGAGSRLGGLSRAVGTKRLVKYGSSEFADEAPFFSAPPQAAQPSGQEEGRGHLTTAKSAPQMHTIVEEEQEAHLEVESWRAATAAGVLQQQMAAGELAGSSTLSQLPQLQTGMVPHAPHVQPHYAPLDFEVLSSNPSDAALNTRTDTSLLPGRGRLSGDGGTSPHRPLAFGGSSLAHAAVGHEVAFAGAPAAASRRQQGGEQGAEPAAPATSAALAGAPTSLPRLRLSRASAPGQGGSARPEEPLLSPHARETRLAADTAAGLVAEEPAAGPQSPRSMHGLVRTRLLPAAADRQAVQHVGEILLSEDVRSQQQQQPGSPGPASPARSARPAAFGGGALPAASGSPFAAAPAAGSEWEAQQGSQGRGRLSLLGPPAGSGGSGGSRTGAGPSSRRFGGQLLPQPSTGLAGLLKPPSPVRISPFASAAASPMLATDLSQAARLPPEVVAGPDASTARTAEIEEELEAGGREAHLRREQLRHGGSTPSRGSGAVAESEVEAEADDDVGSEDDDAEEVVDTGLEVEEEAELFVERQGSQPLHQHRLPSLPLHLPARARSLVGVGRDASRLARASAPPQLLLSPQLSAPVSVAGLPIHHHHVPSTSALQPAAGAGVAVAAQFAAARAAVPGIKPWQASAVLLRRSLSSPLIGVAEELGQQQPLSLGNQGDDSAAEAAGEGGAGGGSTRGEMWTQEALSESHMRLVAGLKRYFHAKRGEGLLSAQGLRILDYACDRAMDQAHAPLDIWSVAEREAVGRHLVRILAWLFFRTKRLTGGVPRLIGDMLSITMLVACEVAVEYWMALTWSPQAQWLRESDKAGQLQAEIAEESALTCGFIIAREIEAPERFQAIQSYRAAMAILRQQAAFVDELYASGIVNSGERQAMQEPVQRRARQLEIRGPVWRAPSVREVLRGLPFLHHVPQYIFDWLLDCGQLLEYTRGEVIQGPATAQQGQLQQGCSAPPLGLHIIVYGLVRGSFTDHRGVHHEFFLGSGGVLGLLSALTGQPMSGSGPAVAEANAMHKGPLIFHLPQSVVHSIEQRAAAGGHTFAQLQLDLFRVAGLYVLERLKGEVTARMAAHYQALAVERERRHAIHRAAAAATAAPDAGSLQPEAAAEQQEQAQQQSGQGSESHSLRQHVRWHSSLGTEEEQVGSVRCALGPVGLNGHWNVALALSKDLRVIDCCLHALESLQEAEGSQPRSGSRPGMSATAPFVPLTDSEVLSGMDRHKLWHSAQAFARGTLADIRHRLRDAELLRLAPQQTWRQRSHALLLHGHMHSSLHGSSAASSASSSGPRSPGSRDTLHADLAAPAVLPWLGRELSAKGGGHRHSSGASSLSASPRLVAGIAGALLLVCQQEPGSPLTPSSSAGSSPRAGHGGRQEGLEGVAEAEDGKQDAEAQQPSLPAQAQFLEPAGRPLPVSAALLGMESVVGAP
ncbi:Protein ACTIVITY OF BC1 COMPLEX KINASE 3 [Chlorella vulgaris]